jgi:2-oxo-4-hydroxy-4-carboxy--5-ureidoimidazoline (OHCU) decarboxylase
MIQVTLDHLNAADKEEFIAALGDIFEHVSWLAETVYATRPFPTLAALQVAMTQAVCSA